ncbi:MAG: protoporphyrinogen oxidase [Acidobacteriota bacterium]
MSGDPGLESSAQRDSTATRDRSAVVIGAGLTGLAAAWRLLSEGWQTTLVEASSRLGGCMETVELEGYRIETGPNTVIADPIFDRLREIAAPFAPANAFRPLEEPILAAAAARRRWVVFQGRLQALPASPPALITSPLLSTGAKLRLAGEPWRRGPDAHSGPDSGPDPQESVASFFDRRLGPQVRHRIGDAMVTGIYAGDPEELAIGAAFPKIHQLEKEAGSLIRGMLARRRAAKRSGNPLPKRRILGFPSGFGPWAEALGDAFQRAGGTLLRERPVRGLHKLPSGAGDAPRFEVQLDEGDPLPAHQVILALPQESSRNLLQSVNQQAGLSPLPELLPNAPVAVLSLGVPTSAIEVPLNGFGFLAPHQEQRNILGCLVSSALFAGRAPEGRTLLTVMIGGRRRPGLVQRPDDELLKLVRDELEALLGLSTGAPHDFALLRRWLPGIPQPTADWFAHGEAYGQLEEKLPGLTILGGWRHGVSLPDCARHGWALGSDA